MTLVVVDASVLASVAAGHPNSPSSRLFAAILGGPIEFVACPQLLTELERTLEKRYFVVRSSPQQRTDFRVVVAERAVMYADPVAPPRVLRDADDDYLVALARSAAAEVIITGDRDLLDDPGLEPPAVTPRAACERFGLP